MMRMTIVFGGLLFIGLFLHTGNCVPYSIWFKLPHHPEYKTVVLVGSFNQWDGEQDSLHLRGDSLWVLKKQLPVGYHYYRFLINNKIYLRDPFNHKFGGAFSNSLIIVRPPDVPQFTILSPEWGSSLPSNSLQVLIQLKTPALHFKSKKQLQV